jgi:hypothetical protein
MGRAASTPTLELVRWIAVRPRTYAETIEAWRSNCPRLAVWDDACSDGLVTTNGAGVTLTERGRALLTSAARSLGALNGTSSRTTFR